MAQAAGADRAAWAFRNGVVEVALEPAAPSILEILPFRPGLRPLDELVEPGAGASELGGFLRSGGAGETEDEGLWILFRLGAARWASPAASGAPSEAQPADAVGATDGAAAAPIEVRMSAWFVPRAGEEGPSALVPGLSRIPVPARHVAGAFGVAGGLPRWLTTALGDQDGLYPSAGTRARSCS